MIKRLLFVLLGLSASLLPAQNILQEIAESQILSPGERRIVPQRYRTFQLDRASLQSLLNQVQGRNAAANRENTQPIVNMPLPDGGGARFYLTESTVMAPALQARYPEIRAFTGHGVDDPSTLLKCEWTPRGFHAMLFLTGKGTVFIDPYGNGDTDHYIVYFKKDYLPKAKKQPFSCGTQPADIDREDRPGFPSQVADRGNDGHLRRYRLALACTGEYALFHGQTKPLVLAAMVTSMNRVNGVYEREFAVTMELIANNDTLINLDGDTDPYDNEDGGTMLGQNKTACNARVGSANYDMGHVFSTGGGGIASLQCICTEDKAMGVTGQDEPIGDAFDIDYVAHEMGHQFGGNHTQNNDCNRYGETAMETGSGSTIMGYAGICAPDVQPHSDDYFHGINVEEMLDFILNGDANGCPVKLTIANSQPIVSAGPDFIIPKSTPFVLTAAGSDADGDENKLTYCWEQMDPDEAPMPPESGSNLGPLFRSYNPDTLPLRYFPRLQHLVLNQTDDWEKPPSVGRKLNFRVTLRDNHPAGGSTAQDDMLVTVNNNAGPFRVSAPGIGVNWLAGSWQIVTWDVANTDKAPVSCKNVNIRLSIDGGYTYPILLAANVLNNGKYCIRVPDVTTDIARLKVEAADNIFFDINNFNFDISPAAAPSFSLCISELIGQVCLPAAYTATVSTSALLGFDTPLALSVQGLPANAVAVFTPNPVTPGNDAVLSLTFPDGSLEETLNLTVLGTADSTDVAVPSTLTLVSNDFDNLALQTPVNGATGQNQTPVLHWQAVPDADFYDVELATGPSFDLSLIVASRQNTAIDSFKVPVLLEKGLVYYWRVRPKNECGPGTWAGPFAFSTLVNVCAVKNANGLPINITGNQPVTVEAKIVFSGSSIISDINVAKIQGSHQFFKELEAILISPKGTELQLFKGKCGGYSGNFNFGFDDAGPTEGPTCPPSTTGVIFRPVLALSKFTGEDAAGEWILRVKDDAAGSNGMLSAFSLEICANTTLNPPVLVNNNTLFIEPGKNKTVTTDLLKTTDQDNTDDQLIYTLMTLPRHGQLQVNVNGPLAVGAQFLQTDLNNGAVQYFHYGGNSTDDFCFTVTDGQGGLVQDCFTIQPFPVSTRDADHLLEFTMAPNPASELLRILFSEALRSDTRIRLLDASGRLLREANCSSGQLNGALRVAGLPVGIYLLVIDNDEGYGTRKVVVR